MRTNQKEFFTAFCRVLVASVVAVRFAIALPAKEKKKNKKQGRKIDD